MSRLWEPITWFPLHSIWVQDKERLFKSLFLYSSQPTTLSRTRTNIQKQLFSKSDHKHMYVIVRWSYIYRYLSFLEEREISKSLTGLLHVKKYHKMKIDFDWYNKNRDQILLNVYLSVYQKLLLFFKTITTKAEVSLMMVVYISSCMHAL